ncbi:MAG: cytochrome d ubiquinol oxidase subunit II [Methylococcales bacterium]|nr:cytochrome d ubiquinol oxidase subunit II [Methylococcales bacterium]
MFDYESLRLIWWALLVFMVCGFAVMDGFDLGIGFLLPFIGKSDDERRVLLNTIGPTWEGNQTWLITLGGIAFGAWSIVYATLFSGLYSGMLLLLFGLLLRPVGFDYRSKLSNPEWRAAWDWALFAGGAVPAVVLSLAAGNLMIGLPFYIDADLRSFYTGSFWGLFQPFALLTVVVGVALLALHGAVFLHWRTEGVIAKRARVVIIWASVIFSLSFIAAGIWLAYGLDGYQVSSAIDTKGVNAVLAKTVNKSTGLWLANYSLYPYLLVAPVLALGGAGIIVLLTAKRHTGWAFLASCLVVIAVIITAAGSMFPFVMPSSTQATSSLTVWDASASHYTLKMLLFAAVILMPVVMAYTTWVYRVMRGKVTVADIQNNSHVLY